MRAVFFDEETARAVVARLRRDGFDATTSRQPLAGEDDDEDHPWVIETDAPDGSLELLVEEHDGWVDPEDVAPPPAPLVLPTAPRRTTRPDP